MILYNIPGAWRCYWWHWFICGETCWWIQRCWRNNLGR